MGHMKELYIRIHNGGDDAIAAVQELLGAGREPGGLDIVDRLRESVTQCRAVDRSQLLEEAAAEIERLRRLAVRHNGSTVPVSRKGPHARVSRPRRR